MKTTKKLKAYKAMNILGDGKYGCRDKVFEIGKTYKHDGKLEPCVSGFHCCENSASVYNYYSFGDNTEVFEIEIPKGAELIEEGDKWCVSSFKMLAPVQDKSFNIGSKNSGYCNTGNCNTGDWNTGNRNTGNRNTGNRNTGNWNTGNRNTGYWNTGDCNTGNCNTGYCNTGNCNTGNRNTGNWNTGNCNTGNRNTGNWNTGYWNTASYQTGLFNTVEQPSSLFNGAAFVLMSEFKDTENYLALFYAPFKLTKWLENKDLSENERTGEHTNGKQVPVAFKDACKEWWANTPKAQQELIKAIPGFDKKIFKDVTGIKV